MKLQPQDLKYASDAWERIFGERPDLDLAILEQAQQRLYDRVIPIIKPPPRNEGERKQIEDGIDELSEKFFCLVPIPHAIRGEICKNMKKGSQVLTEAVHLLGWPDCPAVVVDTLLARATLLRQLAAHHARPKNEAKKVAQARCIHLCREFLLGIGKHAGTAANPGRPGHALRLAQVLWEHATEIGGTPGEVVTFDALRKVWQLRDPSWSEFAFFSFGNFIRSLAMDKSSKLKAKKCPS